MKIEFPETNAMFDSVEVAMTHLAFEHFPVLIVIDGIRGRFETFTEAEKFIKEQIKNISKN